VASMRDGLRLAKVAGIHPSGHAVDILFLDDGSRVPSVQVMAGAASTNSGINDLSTPAVAASGDPYDPAQTKDRDTYAIVGALSGGVPVVLGFLYPQVCQMLFADMNRRVVRHASDVYETTDADGNHEFYHPSGTYLRIGTSPAHEDLTGKDFDKKWKIGKNTDKAVHVHLEVRNGGVTKVLLDAAPNGDVTVQHVGDLASETGGDAAVSVTGTTVLNSTGAVSVNCPISVTVDTPQATFKGKVNVEGLFTYEAGMIGQGDNGTGNAGSITGTLRTSSGDMIADGVSLKTHPHANGGGTGPSGLPIAGS
jgi:phage baseplate assembly protein gpV